jgi:hypothetical protein
VYRESWDKRRTCSALCILYLLYVVPQLVG